MKTITTLFLFSTLAFALERGEELKLWPNAAPGSEGVTDKEVFTPSDNPKLPKNFKVVHYPSIYAFLPPAGKANGMAVVIAPGGGHSQLVIDKEGWDIADWLNQHGIAGFVVKYRLARAPNSKYTVDGDALSDTHRAMRMVRAHAKEWGVDPARIGFMGFSAGGEMAALMETRFDRGNDSSPDPIERQSSRPELLGDRVSRVQARHYHSPQRRAAGLPDLRRRRSFTCRDYRQSLSRSPEARHLVRDAHLRCGRAWFRYEGIQAPGRYLARPAIGLDGRPQAPLVVQTYLSL